MKLFFLDDSRRRHPSRPGMGPLVAVGGICAAEEAVRPLETALDALCEEFGFPPGDEFKWSPGENLWMRSNLVHDRRQAFYFGVFDIATQHDVKAIVILEDTSRGQANWNAPTAEDDVVQLFLERANNHLYPNDQGLVIADRPGGGPEDDERFLSRCVDTIRTGTPYVQLQRIALTVSAPSHLSRLLQVADVVVGATTARVAGESTYSPPIFERIRPLLRSEGGRIGGVGLKIQPDLRYVNLYHWLVGDIYYRRGNTGWDLPLSTAPYFASETQG